MNVSDLMDVSPKIRALLYPMLDYSLNKMREAGFQDEELITAFQAFTLESFVNAVPNLVPPERSSEVMAEMDKALQAYLKGQTND
jgi:hypothetical protein